MESFQGKTQPLVLWVPETITVTWCKWRSEIFWVRWGFLWLVYFPLQKVKAEWVHPISYLRRVAGQQSGACLHAWQHILVTTAVDQDFLVGWEWQRQKKVRAEDGTCFRVHKQPQAAKCSFHWWSIAEGRVRGLSPPFLLRTESWPLYSCVRSCFLCAGGEKKIINQAGGEAALRGFGGCELWARCVLPGEHSWLLTKKYWIICWTSISAD